MKKIGYILSNVLFIGIIVVSFFLFQGKNDTLDETENASVPDNATYSEEIVENHTESTVPVIDIESKPENEAVEEVANDIEKDTSSKITTTTTESREQSSKPTSATSPVKQKVVEEVTIPDPYLKKKLQSIFGTKTITKQQLQNVKELQLWGFPKGNISDLTGLEYATNLVSIDIANNNVTDLSPLRNSKKLIYLLIQNNKIKDITRFKDFPELTFIGAEDNQLNDASINMLKEMEKKGKIVTYDGDQYTVVEEPKKEEEKPAPVKEDVIVISKLTDEDLSSLSQKQRNILVEWMLSTNKVETREDGLHIIAVITGKPFTHASIDNEPPPPYTNQHPRLTDLEYSIFMEWALRTERTESSADVDYMIRVIKASN